MSDSSGMSYSLQSNVQNVKTKTLIEEVKDIKKLGNAEFSKGNYDVAVTYYTQAIAMCPETEQAVLSVMFQKRAAAYSKLNNNEDCLADCNKALALVPRYKKALSRRARVLSELGNFKLALEDITAVQILDEYKNQDDIMFADSVIENLGKQNLEEYRMLKIFNLPSKTFIDSFMKSFCDDPFSDDFTQALLKLDKNTGLEYALKCIKDQKYEEIEIGCQEELNKTENSLTRRSLALNLLATFCLLRGNNSACIEHFTTVIENPNVPKKLIINSLIKRALVYHEQEEVVKSFEDFKHAESIDPNSSAVYHHRARMYIVDLNFEKAVVDFKKAVDLNPTFFLSMVCWYSARYCQAKKVSKKSDVKKLSRKLKKFVIQHPDIPQSYFLYAKVLFETETYEEVDLLFKKAHEIHPNQADFLVYRALIASTFKSNGVPDAFDFLKEALEIDPKCDLAYETLGALYMQNGKYKEAVDCFEKVIQNLPKSKKNLLNTFRLRDLAVAQLAVIERLEIQCSTEFHCPTIKFPENIQN